jgi:hypothetical protein
MARKWPIISRKAVKHEKMQHFEQSATCRVGKNLRIRNVFNGGLPWLRIAAVTKPESWWNKKRDNGKR